MKTVEANTEMLSFLENNQIASAVVAGLILAFILWLINRVRKIIASSKSDETNTDSDVDQISHEEKSLEQETNEDESVNLTPLQNRILLAYSELETELRVSNLMKAYDISRTETKSHIDILLKNKLLLLGGHSDTGAYYYVTAKGREYLMNIKKSSEN